jgi:adenosylcobinamide kinase/adenosylcobinamide-phosphate guanylyltransferase
VNKIVLVGGGVRSGKSRFALARARALGRERVFVATAEALDAEMQARISAHARERGADFRTLEAPRELPAALARIEHADVVVIDCITLWLSNLLLDGAAQPELGRAVAQLVAQLEARRFHTVVVTNEVGMGVVPESALGRQFRDACGAAHQQLTRVADEIYLGALGALLRLRPDPVALVDPDPHSR